MHRQDIVYKIVEQLKTITSQNGFYSDAGTNVLEWQDLPSSGAVLPAIIVKDTHDKVAKRGSTIRHKLKVKVGIFVGDTDAAWNIREISADVIKVFGQVESLINFQCKYAKSKMFTKSDVVAYDGACLEFFVFYNTPRWEQ
jgi:hypothetical protein